MLALLARQRVEVKPSTGALLQRPLERLSGGEGKDGPRLGDEPGVGSAGPGEPGGHAAAREDGVPGRGPAGALVGPLEALGSGLVGGPLDGRGGVTGGAEPYDQGPNLVFA